MKFFPKLYFRTAHQRDAADGVRILHDEPDREEFSHGRRLRA